MTKTLNNQQVLEALKLYYLDGMEKSRIAQIFNVTYTVIYNKVKGISSKDVYNQFVADHPEIFPDQAEFELEEQQEAPSIADIETKIFSKLEQFVEKYMDNRYNAIKDFQGEKDRRFTHPELVREHVQRLKTTEFKIYSYLRTLGDVDNNTFHLHLQTTGNLLSYSITSLKGTFKELEEKGYIQVEYPDNNVAKITVL